MNRKNNYKFLVNLTIQKPQKEKLRSNILKGWEVFALQKNTHTHALTRTKDEKYIRKMINKIEIAIFQISMKKKNRLSFLISFQVFEEKEEKNCEKEKLLRMIFCCCVFHFSVRASIRIFFYHSLLQMQNSISFSTFFFLDSKLIFFFWFKFKFRCQWKSLKHKCVNIFFFIMNKREYYAKNSLRTLLLYK